MALQLIFLESDDPPEHGIILQEGTDRAVRVKGLKYADDIATILADRRSKIVVVINVAKDLCH